MNKSGIISLLFAILWSPSYVRGQAIVTLHAGEETHHIGQYSSYLEDTSASLTIEEVSAPGYSDKFSPTNRSTAAFGITKSVYWFRLAIVTDGQGLCLYVEPAMVNNLRCYHKVNGKWVEWLSGFDYPLSARKIPTGIIVFPLEQQPDDTVEYFLRVESSFPVLTQVKAGPEREIWVSQIRDNILNGLFFGIMLLMALYNLFLFITNRDRVYILYALYVIFCAMFISFPSGYVAYMPDFVRKLNNFNHIIYPFLFGLFGMLFSQRFLFSKRFAPRLHKVANVLIVLVFISFLVDFFDHHIATYLIQLLGVAFTIISISMGIITYRAGYKPARYYLFGFGIYTLGLSTYIVLGVAQVEITSFSPPYILMVSSAIEAIILSFAIGDKLNAAMRDKQAAQEEKLEALQANEKLIREQNVVLEQKVEERTREINEQKEIIEEKNKDILDSIHYAKRIQATLLASDHLLKNNLGDYFILYKPKDIVSGDFYFGAEQGDKFWLCVGDCTGHGVPGAFMSLLNISILRELIVDQEIQNPDVVLNKQRDAIISALNPDGTSESSKDGMDCALLRFDRKTNELEFACANNSLWIIRKGELIEFKGDKQPVGLHEGAITPYTQHKFKLEKNDLIYALTDGFADQFGGPKGKKFKYAQLKEMILKLHAIPLEEQQMQLDHVFGLWRGELQQVDDVCIIGVRID